MRSEEVVHPCIERSLNVLETGVRLMAWADYFNEVYKILIKIINCWKLKKNCSCYLKFWKSRSLYTRNVRKGAPWQVCGTGFIRKSVELSLCFSKGEGATYWCADQLLGVLNKVLATRILSFAFLSSKEWSSSQRINTKSDNSEIVTIGNFRLVYFPVMQGHAVLDHWFCVCLVFERCLNSNLSITAFVASAVSLGGCRHAAL
jgi:hypothetical protein